MLFTVETVSCLGACGLAPTLTVNDEVHPNMTPEKALALVEELRGEGLLLSIAEKNWKSREKLHLKISNPTTAEF